MSKKIKVAIIGLGNCASSLIQGIYYYKNKNDENNINTIGLMHWDICGYKPYDIEISAVFDIDKRKVNKDVSNAIFKLPNCTNVFYRDIPKMDVEVKMGKILDSISPHMTNYDENYTYSISNEKEPTEEEVIKILKYSNTEILLNYLPVGSEEATKFYANCSLKANVAFINNIPVFIASNAEWANKFKEKNIPLLGDDIKSQIGATIIHRTLATLFNKRGVQLERTYQLNTGGNTDFLNMLNRDRLKSKKESKTEAVQSVLQVRLDDENIHISPSDYVPWQKDNKVAYIRMEGKLFGEVPMNLELRLSVEDSPNSAGVVIDAIRCAKIALDKKIGGVLMAPSALYFKHPYCQMSDEYAQHEVETFINSKGEIYHPYY